MAWITDTDVARLLGPGAGWESDPALQAMVTDAANAYAFRKRLEAGYVDDVEVSPGPDVTFGAALYAVALWRERASTDGYASFEDLSGFQPTGGSWTQIRRLLGVGKAQTDGPPAGRLVVSTYRGRRRL